MVQNHALLGRCWSPVSRGDPLKSPAPASPRASAPSHEAHPPWLQTGGISTSATTEPTGSEEEDFLLYFLGHYGALQTRPPNASLYPP